MKNGSINFFRGKRFKAAAFVLCIAIAGVMFTGCGEYMADNGKPTVVCTIFPEYDWLMNVLGDEASEFNIRLLLQGSTDIHSYQPTAADITAIASCDLLIYPGGESCSWIEDALENSVNDEQQVIRLLDVLGNEALEEEVVEGMQESHFGHGHNNNEETEHKNHADSDTNNGNLKQDDSEHGTTSDDDSDNGNVRRDDSEHEGEGHVHEGEYDEHVWLSLHNAEKFVTAIKEEVRDIYPEKEAVFEENAQAYISGLEALDEKYREIIENADYTTLMFADRFPFRYFIEDYGLQYYAAFSGCSADAEASFETVTFLAEKLKSERLPALLILESTDDRLAETIINTSEASDVEILVIDSMQSIPSGKMDGGYTYLGAMESNLEVIKQALEE